MLKRNYKFNLLPLIAAFLLFFGALGQTPRIDTLKNILKTKIHDSTRCKILIELVETGSDEEWPMFLDQLFEVSKKNASETKPTSTPLYSKHLADAIFYYGYKDQVEGDLSSALGKFQESLIIREQIGDRQGVSISLNNIAIVYRNMGNMPKALSYYGKSLKIREEIGDKAGIAQSMNNLAVIYKIQGEILKAIEFLQQSLILKKGCNDKLGEAESLINLGAIYNDYGDPALPSKEESKSSGKRKALEYLEQGLAIAESIKERKIISAALFNLGFLHKQLGETDKAITYLNRAQKIAEEIGDKRSIAISLNYLGFVYLQQKNYTRSLEYGTKSMAISREIGYPQNIKDAAGLLKEIYDSTGNHKLALENFEVYITMRDSINNESTRKASIKSQLKYEYEKQAAADSVAHAKESEIKNAELAKQKAEISAKKNQQYALFGGLFAVCVFGVFMYNRFKVTQKQKEIIEEQKLLVESQKHLVEEKQKEVLDSIHYARRIQMAQIPSEKQVSKHLEKSKNA